MSRIAYSSLGMMSAWLAECVACGRQRLGSVAAHRYSLREHGAQASGRPGIEPCASTLTAVTPRAGQVPAGTLRIPAPCKSLHCIPTVILLLGYMIILSTLHAFPQDSSDQSHFQAIPSSQRYRSSASSADMAMILLCPGRPYVCYHDSSIIVIVQ